MNLARWFKPRPETVAGQALYLSIAAQARRPELYSGLGAPDTFEGRFELYVLHFVLLHRRLLALGPKGGTIAQAVFDAFVRGMDDSLRERGVGDTTVPKKMKLLVSALYGRMRAYGAAIEASDQAALAEALDGAIPGTPDGAAGLAAYALRAAAVLRDNTDEALTAGTASWPEPLT
ncbi:MAG: ubiquinol-cytochrome C chaperone family protein [Caulobacteraceae bacterium]